MTAEEIVRELTSRAWTFDVSVLLSPKPAIVCDDGTKCSGWFNGETKQLIVSTGCPVERWLGVLLHEYSHLTQWIENCDIWREQSEAGDMWEWLNGKRERNIGRIIDLTQDLEADCERRALRLAQELSAPIDLESYARAANAYIHFHNVVRDKRKWVRAAGALSSPEILKHCNPTIDTDYRKTPKALYDALIKHAI